LSEDSSGESETDETTSSGGRHKSAKNPFVPKTVGYGMQVGWSNREKAQTEVGSIFPPFLSFQGFSSDLIVRKLSRVCSFFINDFNVSVVEKFIFSPSFRVLFHCEGFLTVLSG
jgi:hypothetical protein